MADYNSSYTGQQIDSAVGKALTIPTTPNLIKGNNSGGVAAATPGTDYQTPLVAGTDYATPSQIPSVPSASSNNPLMDGTASPGVSDAYARGDHIHPTDTSRLAVYDNAGAHNGIYRGKYLCAEVTQAQWDAIGAGTFDDLYIGDYWTINNVNWRIAAFDYWLGTGNTECTTHHVVIVPDTCLDQAIMNTSNTTSGAYVGSKMYTTNLAQAKTTINNAFGSAHVLNHREYFANATSNGYQSAGAWYDSTVDLMNEQMVCGCRVYSNAQHGTNIPNAYTIDRSQLPLFALAPQYVCSNNLWWLRDVVSSVDFVRVHFYGQCAPCIASDIWTGVRPAFGICA